MGSTQYSYCPQCGNKLIQIDSELSICFNKACRTSISNSVISKMELDKYSKIQEKIKIVDNREYKTYMLLKENLSAPMLIKNTNTATETKRNTYCIIKAKNIDEAILQFQQKFKYIKVNSEMVVEVSVKEV